MHKDEKKKETRGRKFIADPMERMETFRVGLKKALLRNGEECATSEK